MSYMTESFSNFTFEEMKLFLEEKRNYRHLSISKIEDYYHHCKSRAWHYEHWKVEHYRTFKRHGIDYSGTKNAYVNKSEFRRWREENRGKLTAGKIGIV